MAELRADDGWLTVTGLLWLKPGQERCREAPAASDIRLPAKAPKRLGVFELADGRVTFTADPADGDVGGGAGAAQKALDTRGGDTTALTIGDLRMFLIRREDCFAHPPARHEERDARGFDGLTYFPLDEAYRVDATFTAYPEPARSRSRTCSARTRRWQPGRT